MLPFGFPELVPAQDTLYPGVPPVGLTKIDPVPPLQGTLVGELETSIGEGGVMVKLVAVGQLLLSSIEMLYVPG